MESSQIVAMHIRSLDQNKAIKTVKHTITELDRSKIEGDTGAVGPKDDTGRCSTSQRLCN